MPDTPKTPTYTSLDEVRDRLAMRRAITLQQTSRRAGHYPALRSIVARGAEAAARLEDNGRLNTRYGVPGTNRPVPASTRKLT